MGCPMRGNVSNLKQSIFSKTQIKCSSISNIKSIQLKLPQFSNFSLLDLKRLKKDDEWLSDSHVTLALLFVLF